MDRLSCSFPFLLTTPLSRLAAESRIQNVFSGTLNPRFFFVHPPHPLFFSFFFFWSRRYVVTYMFGAEHALLLLGLLVQFGIHDMPKWVKQELQRRAYVLHQRLLHRHSRDRVKTD
jgi:hypothetical protein